MDMKEIYERPEMLPVDIFGVSPLCVSPEGFEEGDEGGWLDGDD